MTLLENKKTVVTFILATLALVGCVLGLNTKAYATEGAIPSTTKVTTATAEVTAYFSGTGSVVVPATEITNTSSYDITITSITAPNGYNWANDAQGKTVKAGETLSVNWTTTGSISSDVAEQAISAGKLSIGNMTYSFEYKVPIEAFAVYSADDNSLNFYKRAGVPTEGSTFEGKTATAVYTGIETMKTEMSGIRMTPPSWYYNEDYFNIESVAVIDEGIKPISTSCWFYNLYNLTSCDLSKLDTSQVTNMSNMFGFCRTITSVGDLSNWNTSNVTDMSAMFQGCNNLISVNLSNWNTSSVTDLSLMFNQCSSITELNLSNWNTSKVSTLESMFGNCTSLNTLNLSSWDTSRVTSMRGMFNMCTSLTSIEGISSLNTSKLTTSQDMFSGCSKLTSLDLSGWNVSSVTNVSSMFAGCSSLTNLDLSNWDTLSITNMSNMFQNCSSLTTLKGISNWNTSSVTSTSRMFQSCDNLTSLNLSNWNTSSVTDARYMFGDCNKFQEITLGANWKWVGTNGYLPTPSSTYIPDADGKWYAASDGQGYAPADIPSNKADTYYAVPPKQAFVVFSYDDFGLKFYKRAEVPNPITDEYFDSRSIDGVYLIDESAQYGESNIPWSSNVANSVESVTIVDNGISPQSTAYWFSGFNTLKSIKGLDKLDVSKVTDMSCMFQSCNKLTSLDLSGWNTSSVTDIQYMFNQCESLTTLNLSNWDTSNVSNMSALFFACGSLQEIKGIADLDTSKVTSTAGMFMGAYKGALDLSNWNVSNVTDMDSMFNSTSLTNLDLSGWNTSSVTDMQYMFNSNPGLTSIEGISSWNTSNVTNMLGVFVDCQNLTNLNLSNWDISNVTASTRMFDGCNKLQEITLGDNWKWVGTDGYLPTPSSTYIPDADGKWYAASDGQGYAPADIPSNKADTYYAVPPKQAFVVFSGGNSAESLNEPLIKEPELLGTDNSDESVSSPEDTAIKPEESTSDVSGETEEQQLTEQEE